VIERLEGFIAERWAELVRLDGRAAQFDQPTTRPPFTDDEAKGFMRGIDAELFEIKAVTTKAGVPEMAYECAFCDIRQYLFADGAKTGKRTFSREFVPQWGAACDLITQHGWPVENVLVESDDLWGLDLVVFDRDRHEADRRPVIAGEVKSRVSDMQRQVEEMKQCGGLIHNVHRGWPGQPGRTAHNKCTSLLGLLTHQPLGRITFCFLPGPVASYPRPHVNQRRRPRRATPRT
jgi:hypothetical protein